MESVNSSSRNSPLVIPDYFHSRLEALTSELELNTHAETIQALFTWTEMGLAIAQQLEISSPTPQAIFESFQKLRSSATGSSSNIASVDSSGSGAIFERDSINQLCTSIRLLSEALSSQQKNQTSQKLGLATYFNQSNQSQNHRVDNNRNNSHKLVEPVKPFVNESDTSKVPSSSTPAQTSKQEVSPKVSNRRVEAEQDVERAIDAIIKFNNAEEVATEDKWHIGIGSLKKLSHRGDSVINRVIKNRKEEIEQHHSVHGLGKWHNARGKDYPSIDEIIVL